LKFVRQYIAISRYVINPPYKKTNTREKKWGVAVGRCGFINHLCKRSDHTVKERNIIASEETVELREHQSPYNAVFDPETATLRPENMCYWNVFVVISIK